MIRFILRNRRRDEHSGAEAESLFSIDGDVAAVEQALRRGGYGPSGYDITNLVGVEVLDDPAALPTPARAEGAGEDIPQHVRDEWKRERGRGMTSAVGEYTPAEFWTLLEAYEELLAALATESA